MLIISSEMLDTRCSFIILLCNAIRLTTVNMFFLSKKVTENNSFNIEQRT